jgi:MFS family permease
MEHLIVAEHGASEGRAYVRFDAAAPAGAGCNERLGPQPQAPPPTRRYLTLLCASLFSVGAHVCYTMTSSIEKDLLASLGINNEQYGTLNSAVSWASLAGLPFAAGVFVDGIPTRFAAVLFSFTVFFGHLIFALGVMSQSYFMAVIGRIVFGVGESTVLVVQGALVCQWFRSREQLALAIGVTEMTHNVANWLGKVSLHVGLAIGGSWEATLWFGLAVCFLSVLTAVAYFRIEKRADPAEFIARKSTPRCTELGGLQKLHVLFWMFCLLHLLVSNVEHLFDAISAKFIYFKWHMQWSDAVWVSSLNYAMPIVMSPVVGHMLDSVSNRMIIASLACALMAAGHIMLTYLAWTPIAGMLTLAAAQSVLPTIIRSSAALVVPHRVTGIAFGMFGVAENFGKVLGNPLVGYIKDQTGDYFLDGQIFVGMSSLAVLLCVTIGVLDARGENALRRRRPAPPPEAQRDSLQAVSASAGEVESANL